MTDNQSLTPKMTSFFRKHLAWVITLFLTGVFVLQMVNLNRKLKEKDNTITQIELDKQTLRETTNRQGRQIQEQDVILTNSRKALSRLTDTIFDLRRRDSRNLETIAYFKGVTKASIKNIQIPYLDTVFMERFKDSVLHTREGLLAYIEDSTIQVPNVAKVDSVHFQLALSLAKKGVTLDSLSIPNTLELRFVESGGNLFRSPRIEVQYFNSNPYIKNISSNSVFYQPKKKSFFTRIILPVAVGVGAGILISK